MCCDNNNVYWLVVYENKSNDDRINTIIAPQGHRFCVGDHIVMTDGAYKVTQIEWRVFSDKKLKSDCPRLHVKFLWNTPSM